MVSLRLKRIGSKKRPYYRIVAVDSRKRRDGRVLENLGHYHPIEAGNKVINKERVNFWISQGAQPSLTVLKLLK